VLLEPVQHVVGKLRVISLLGILAERFLQARVDQEDVIGVWPYSSSADTESLPKESEHLALVLLTRSGVAFVVPSTGDDHQSLL